MNSLLAALSLTAAVSAFGLALRLRYGKRLILMREAEQRGDHEVAAAHRRYFVTIITFSALGFVGAGLGSIIDVGGTPFDYALIVVGLALAAVAFRIWPKSR